MTVVDTIYALATPPGRSGVAVIRVSGDNSLKSLTHLAERFCSSGERAPRHKEFNLCKLIHPVSRETIDRALVVYFKGPASFTGEDIVEYHLHGGGAVIKAMLDALSKQPGHRMAEPGEFTRRAFENGKIDLTSAEAVADLIDAETQAQKLQALSQMEGSLSRLYDDWRDRLLQTLAYLEADIDFPDEDLPGGIAAQARPALRQLVVETGDHLDDKRRGELLRDGLRVVVIGAPNVGKSSLVNALAQRDVAIVSEHAGTTRDVIDVHLDLGGYPVILSDTAGLRPGQLGTGAQETIESEGIRRALKRAQAADIKLLLFDATQTQQDEDTLALVDDQALVVFNKCDAAAQDQDAAGLRVSAQTGEGLDKLIETLTARIAGMLDSRETPSLTRQRHRDALEDCRAALMRALDSEMPELMAEDVRLAVRALGRITGRVDVEDLLDVIFRDFCIGK